MTVNHEILAKLIVNGQRLIKIIITVLLTVCEAPASIVSVATHVKCLPWF